MRAYRRRMPPGFRRWYESIDRPAAFWEICPRPDWMLWALAALDRRPSPRLRLALEAALRSIDQPLRGLSERVHAAGVVAIAERRRARESESGAAETPSALSAGLRSADMAHGFAEELLEAAATAGGLLSVPYARAVALVCFERPASPQRTKLWATEFLHALGDVSRSAAARAIRVGLPELGESERLIGRGHSNFGLRVDGERAGHGGELRNRGAEERNARRRRESAKRPPRR